MKSFFIDCEGNKDKAIDIILYLRKNKYLLPVGETMEDYVQNIDRLLNSTCIYTTPMGFIYYSNRRHMLQTSSFREMKFDYLYGGLIDKK